MYDTIELGTETRVLTDGHYTVSEQFNTIYCEYKSVTRTEFYQSYQAGLNASIVFIVLTEEVGDATVVKHRGKTYKILRQYIRDDDYTELTCGELN